MQTVVIDNIDIDLLIKQKAELLTLVNRLEYCPGVTLEQREAVDGMIHLCDAIQDAAIQDLFETPELIPPAVQSVLDTWDEDADGYKECKRLEDELKPLGYTFDWYLTAEPYNLRKIEN
jgi:hypothetical protein